MINLIKTKVKGRARNLISNEQRISAIVTHLSKAVEGESVEVISAKLLNLQQKSKTANNQYTQEVETLAKALEGAYISDGLTSELAHKYSTNLAVKAMTQNCSSPAAFTLGCLVPLRRVLRAGAGLAQ